MSQVQCRCPCALYKSARLPSSAKTPGLLDAQSNSTHVTCKNMLQQMFCLGSHEEAGIGGRVHLQDHIDALKYPKGRLVPHISY